MAGKLYRLEAIDLELDPHVHIYTNPRASANRLWADPGSRKLKDLFKYMIGVNSLGITNSVDDNNYERWTEQATDLPRDYWVYQDDRATQIITPRKQVFTFFKTQELFTKQGHALIFGVKSGKYIQDFRTIDESYEYVKEDACHIVIAAHVFAHGGLGENLYGREGMFNAYEFNSMAGKKANRKIMKKAAEDRKPLVHGSDTHRPEFIGRAVNRFNAGDLSFVSGGELVWYIKENMRGNNFAGFSRGLPLIAPLHHLWVIGLYKLGIGRSD